MLNARLLSSSHQLDDAGLRTASLPSYPFCVQQYIDRKHLSSYLSVWRQIYTANHDIDKGTGTSQQVRLRETIYLLNRERGASSFSEFTQQERDEDIQLEALSYDDDDASTRAVLSAAGLDADATIPHLLQIKLLTAEIVGRMNHFCTSRQVVGLACEFFVSASPEKVYFEGIAGIHWLDSMPTWTLLADVDPLSNAIEQISFDARVPVLVALGNRHRTNPQPI
ncbi:hypothetical protein PINS_up006241 [Pythium insidiosum]|nr:hypothetical protein PINS_up006241 [Pythium insidiosum]